MSPLSLWAIIFLAGLGIGSVTSWRVQSWRHDAQLLAQQAKAQEREAQWQQDANTADEVRDREIKDIHADHLLELERLRDRPAKRMPQTAAASCQGASGKELAGGDADFLAGYAADAAIQQAELRKCQAWINAVTAH